jgi:hypothetical protein
MKISPSVFKRAQAALKLGASLKRRAAVRCHSGQPKGAFGFADRKAVVSAAGQRRGAARLKRHVANFAEKVDEAQVVRRFVFGQS